MRPEQMNNFCIFVFFFIRHSHHVKMFVFFLVCLFFLIKSNIFVFFGLFGFFDIAQPARPQPARPRPANEKKPKKQKNQTFLIYSRGLVALLGSGWLARHKENPT